MIMQATVSSRSHPEYGVATIPLPIPDGEYGPIIELLEAMGIGDATAQDCWVDELSSDWPALRQLESQSVNVDEMDYLAKRLDSFCGSEKAQFQAMVSVLGLSDVKELIDLTFCCQQVTVISDFACLEQIGKDHRLTISGGGMPADEYWAVDGEKEALDLIQSGTGVVTPFGVVYDNGMVLEQVYAGGVFPPYQYGDALLTLGVPIQPEIGGPVETAWLYLPAPEQQLDRTLRRIGITNGDAAYFIEDSTLPPEVFAVLERPDDAIPELNRLCQAVAPLDGAQREKLAAVVLMAQPEEAGEIRQLAEQMGSPCGPSHRRSAWGEEPQRSDRAMPTGRGEGYGACGDEMREDPAEAYQREQQIGGLA